MSLRRAIATLLNEDAPPPFVVSDADPGAIGRDRCWLQRLPAGGPYVEMICWHRDPTNSYWIKLFDSIKAGGIGDPSSTLVLDIAVETETAFDITPARAYTLDLAEETDTAFDITPS